VSDLYIPVISVPILLQPNKQTHIEEGRAASKSPPYKFCYFLSFSEQAVSADITKNSANI
jgi:hypothetical protein